MKLPLFDYRCTLGHTQEHLVSSDTKTMQCPVCLQVAYKIHLKVAKPDWLALAQGASASPEAINRFDKMHRKQADKESKSMSDHGDYGPRPGAD